MIRLIEKYKSIGEETRFRIIRVLIKAGCKLCVCEIVDVLRKPQYTVSKALSILKIADLVEERREGKLMFYKLKNNPINHKLFESISLAPKNPVYSADFNNLKKRLAMRKEGKCVVTYR